MFGLVWACHELARLRVVTARHIILPFVNFRFEAQEYSWSVLQLLLQVPCEVTVMGPT
jgi:hypothetical protein